MNHLFVGFGDTLIPLNGDVAILGRNGEENNLIATLAGLMRPDEGTIRCSSTPYHCLPALVYVMNYQGTKISSLVVYS